MKTFNPLTDADILAEVRYQSSQASGSEFASDELQEERQAALRAYLGKPIGNEIDGNSTVQSLDVADMIDAMTSQIMPIFSSDDIVQFEPMGS
jgi:ATP-dependent exoDNAse (exonuclease V) alpha subunit